VPISRLQSDILQVIARFRDPESFVAGGVPINRSGPRFSSDIDIFHDRQERVAEAALADAGALVDAGYQITWLRQQPATYAAAIRRGADETKLEWVADSDYRFFPVVQDDQFGFVLHIVDLAVNKVMAAASRREPRDIVDVLTLHDHVLSLGAVVWAATEGAPGYTPEGLIAEIRRNARYRAEELRQLLADPPIDPVSVFARLRIALDEAEQFVGKMPTADVGILFLAEGRLILPDPAKLDEYTHHRAQRRGHWPSSPEISSSMLQALRKQLP
jgi:hypothetical protein